MFAPEPSEQVIELFTPEAAGTLMGIGSRHLGGPSAEQLRVVDASIFATIPCANTNFPTMMVVNKIADNILMQPSSSLNETHAVRQGGLRKSMIAGDLSTHM